MFKDLSNTDILILLLNTQYAYLSAMSLKPLTGVVNVIDYILDILARKVDVSLGSRKIQGPRFNG